MIPPNRLLNLVSLHESLKSPVLVLHFTQSYHSNALGIHNLFHLPSSGESYRIYMLLSKLELFHKDMQVRQINSAPVMEHIYCNHAWYSSLCYASRRKSISAYATSTWNCVWNFTRNCSAQTFLLVSVSDHVRKHIIEDRFHFLMYENGRNSFYLDSWVEQFCVWCFLFLFAIVTY